MRKLVFIHFLTNFYSDDPEEFLIYGFNVDDPTGQIQKFVDQGHDKLEDLHDEIEGTILGSTLDEISSPDIDFWGGYVYELSLEHKDKMTKAANRLYEFFESIGGVNGPMVETTCTEQATDSTLDMIRTGELT